MFVPVVLIFNEPADDYSLSKILMKILSLKKKKNAQTSRDLDNCSLTSLMSYSDKVMEKVVCASELTDVTSVAAVNQTKP